MAMEKSPLSLNISALLDVEDLAQEIRRIDGQHQLGAGQLAERLHPFLVEQLAKGLKQALCAQDELDENGLDEERGSALVPNAQSDAPLTPWQVQLCRTAYGFHTLEVLARTEQDARALALEEAGDIEFSTKSAEYSVESVTPRP